LYNLVRKLRDDKIDCSMDTAVVKDRVDTWEDVGLSKTLLLFHGVVFGTTVIVTLVAIVTFLMSRTTGGS